MKYFKRSIQILASLAIITATTLLWYFYNDTKDPYVKQCDYTIPDSIIPKFTEVNLPFEHRFDETKSLPSLGASVIDINGDDIDEIFIGGGYGQQDVI